VTLDNATLQPKLTCFPVRTGLWGVVGLTHCRPPVWATQPRRHMGGTFADTLWMTMGDGPTF
jgi:hypothetical protein